jgi:N-acetylglucosamine-6-phosphate deacetylase
MGFCQKGVLALGRDADIALFDRDIRVEMTIVGGKIVYHRGGETD